MPPGAIGRNWPPEPAGRSAAKGREVFQRIYQWVMAKAGTRQAVWVLAVVSFSESALLPLPVDAVVIPLMLADRQRVWRVALIATLASVAGGAAGYAIGMFLYETLGRWLIDFYGLGDSFLGLQEDLGRTGWAWVAVGGISPLPYKLVAIACGLLKFSFPMFLAVSAASRGIRFLVIAVLFHQFGPRMRVFLDNNGPLVGWSMLLLLAGGFAGAWLLG
jgi:membrane protein YqaA with SNARE-associated domain